MCARRARSHARHEGCADPSFISRGDRAASIAGCVDRSDNDAAGAIAQLAPPDVEPTGVVREFDRFVSLPLALGLIA